LTLPNWALLTIVVSIPLGVVVRLARRSRLFWGWVVVVAMAVFFEGSTLPHGGWAMAWYLGRDARPALEDLDLALSRGQREEIVRRAELGQLAPSTAAYASREAFLLPEGFAGLVDGSEVWVRQDECGIRVFFRTITGFSPDPYGGFEFASPGCQPEVDPLGSGAGLARDIGGGWYWIDAS
ncbi:MAG TPA: hypothetical protein VGM49_08270, partial [Candidatus Limnocylindrales bacterium]